MKDKKVKVKVKVKKEKKKYYTFCCAINIKNSRMPSSNGNHVAKREAVPTMCGLTNAKSYSMTSSSARCSSHRLRPSASKIISSSYHSNTTFSWYRRSFDDENATSHRSSQSQRGGTHSYSDGEFHEFR